MANTGKMEWMDLTVDDAEIVRKFYQKVVGWSPEAFDMDDYKDYNMNDANGETIAGICHARGGNASIPPMWVPYITVNSLDESLSEVKKGGGKLINGPRQMPQDKYAIISDPAGACCAIWEKNE